MKNYFILTLLISLFLLASCGKDDEPTFAVNTSSITDDKYTFEGTPAIQYSVDNGATYTSTLPSSLPENSKVLAKITNGSEDLKAEDFEIDWSGSSPSPVVNNGIAEFTINDELSINVSIEDKMTLVTSSRFNGKFHRVDLATGDTTFIFNASHDGSDLVDIRAFVYHYGQKKFFASQSSNPGGYLYSIDPSSMEATMINANDGANGAAVWDAVVNWAVAPDDSLIAIGDFNDDGNGIVKFGTDGGRSLLTSEVDFCCGMGMLYDVEKGFFTIANGWNTGDQEIEIQTINSAGTLLGTSFIKDFQGFPDDLSSEWLTVKSIAKAPNGDIYGLLFAYDLKRTYFVKVDLENFTIKNVKQWTVNNSVQYNSLTFIPNYLL